MATLSGVSAFSRTFSNPEAEHTRRQFASRANLYRYYWSWYNSQALKDLSLWSQYRNSEKLYRQTRLIYNPTERLVNFYAENVYPGILAETNVGIPPGVPLAIPFARDMDPKLRGAVAQLWEWSRWATGKTVMVRWAAALGNTLVEIVDNPATNKVYLINRWPGQVVDLVLDDVGNVKLYALEYMAQDSDNQTYIYRKEVDGLSIATFKNDKPFSYEAGVPARYANPYGFVPAVWVPHVHVGGVYGSPAIQGSVDVMGELNSTASMAHDQVRKLLAAPQVFWTDATADELFAIPKRAPSEDLEDEGVDRENVPFIVGPAGGKVESLMADMDLNAVSLYVDSMITEIEKRHPELRMFDELRKMSQVTGPAAFRLVADVSNRLYETSANYDRASVALFQMGVAIAGERLKRGNWKDVTAQQRKFEGFDLQSYARGDLDLRILPRPLLQPTAREHADEENLLWTAAGQAVEHAGVPLKFLFNHWEWTEEKIALFESMRDEEDKRALDKQKQQSAMVVDQMKATAQVQSAATGNPPDSGKPTNPPTNAKPVTGGASSQKQPQSKAKK